MEHLQISGLGDIGLLTDPPAIRIPNNAFTRLENMRCVDGWLRTFGSWTLLQDHSVDVRLLGLTNPYYIVAFNTGTEYFWVLFTDDAIYATSGGAATDISSTRGYLGFSDLKRWSAAISSGVIMHTHPNLYPEYWDGNLGNICQPLPYTDTKSWEDENKKTNVIREHKGFGIALGITDGITEYPHTIQWSHPAESNVPPIDWDYTDPTNLAGRNDMIDEGGRIIEGLSMRDNFIVYKVKTMWSMDYVGGPFVWRFRPIINSVGILARDCVAEVKGNHFIFADDDIVRHNGTIAESIIHKKDRKFLFSKISPDTYQNSFVVHNSPAKEIWFCFPEEGATYPTMAMLYNWRDDTWNVRDLNEPRHISPGKLLGADETIDDPPPIAIDEWYGAVDARNFSTLTDSILGVTQDGGVGYVWSYDSELIASSPSYTAIAERVDLLVDGKLETFNTVTKIVPNFETTGSVDVYIGGQQKVGGAVSWKGPFPYDSNTNKKIDCRVTGALHAWRITRDGKNRSQFSGMEITYVPAGLRQ